MQKSLYYMKVLRCTAGENYQSHVGTLALDFGGLDGGKSDVFAPFDLIIKRIDTAANTVFFESMDEVETPTFTDHVCGRFAHCDSLPYICKVGNVILQGTSFYKEGTKAGGKIGAMGSHVHAVFGRGKLKGSYWKNVGNGNYAMNCTGGSIHQWNAFFVPREVRIVKTDNYTDAYPWLREKKEEETDVSKRTVCDLIITKANLEECGPNYPAYKNAGGRDLACALELNKAYEISEVTEGAEEWLSIKVEGVYPKEAWVLWNGAKMRLEAHGAIKHLEMTQAPTEQYEAVSEQLYRKRN